MRSEIILIIAGMALVTYLTRFGFLALLSNTGLPSRLHIWLKHIPTAILTSLIMPGLFLPRGYLDLSAGNHHLLAGIAAAVVAYKSRNIVATIGIGMTIMILLKFIN